MARKRKTHTPVRERSSQRGVLAALVTARREELDLLQDDLAALAGCSTRFVHDLEAGKDTVQLNKVLDVLSVLGLHLELGSGAAAPSSPVTLSPDLVRIYDLAGDGGAGPIP